MKFTKNQVTVIRCFYERNSKDFDFLSEAPFISLMNRFGSYTPYFEAKESVKAFCLFDDLVYNTSIDSPDFHEFVSNRNGFIYGKR